ncbi:MAG: glutaredoxin [Xanthomonadaceae bacterium]|nr:glutaredoxin [Xanthomonadaceae bacterium]
MPESPSMHIVVYQSVYCPACRRTAAELIDLCRQFDADAEVRDVMEHLEQAARLGIVRLPAVVIDGRLFGQGNAALGKLRRKERA